MLCLALSSEMRLEEEPFSVRCDEESQVVATCLGSVLDRVPTGIAMWSTDCVVQEDKRTAIVSDRFCHEVILEPFCP